MYTLYLSIGENFNVFVISEPKCIDMNSKACSGQYKLIGVILPWTGVSREEMVSKTNLRITVFSRNCTCWFYDWQHKILKDVMVNTR